MCLFPGFARETVHLVGEKGVVCGRSATAKLSFGRGVVRTWRWTMDDDDDVDDDDGWWHVTGVCAREVAMDGWMDGWKKRREKKR